MLIVLIMIANLASNECIKEKDKIKAIIYFNQLKYINEQTYETYIAKKAKKKKFESKYNEIKKLIEEFER